MIISAGILRQASPTKQASAVSSLCQSLNDIVHCECCYYHAGSFALAIETMAYAGVPLANPLANSSSRPELNDYAPGLLFTAPGLLVNGQERDVYAPGLAATALHLFGE